MKMSSVHIAMSYLQAICCDKANTFLQYAIICEVLQPNTLNMVLFSGETGKLLEFFFWKLSYKALDNMVNSDR